MDRLFQSPLLLLTFALFSCSQLQEVVQEPEELVNLSEGMPHTKAYVEPPKMSKEEILGYVQSNHITMLVNGVDYIDSVYVQTLTEQDMKDLKSSCSLPYK